MLGTLGVGFPNVLMPATHTTPDAVALQEQLADWLARGARHVAMEVSSHGLDQGRVNSAVFAAALFTNLSRDHLDYHGSMEHYGAAKARLFRWPGLQHAVVNLDDPFGAALAASLDRTRVQVLGYGFGKGEIAGHRLDLSRRGLRLEIATPWGAGAIQSQLLGAFNAANLLGVLGVLLAAGVKLDEACEALAHVEPPAGRLQMIRVPERPLVVVDYAHTPDALEKVLETLRALVADGARLCCVFGCGGDRDPGKRPLMGEVATRLADRIIVTSDNPRSENPRAIIDAVIAGAHANYHVEERPCRGHLSRGARGRARGHRADRRQGARDLSGDRRRAPALQRRAGRARGTAPAGLKRCSTSTLLPARSALDAAALERASTG